MGLKKMDYDYDYDYDYDLVPAMPGQENCAKTQERRT